MAGFAALWVSAAKAWPRLFPFAGGLMLRKPT